jgi:hypothetical protein
MSTTEDYIICLQRDQELALQIAREHQDKVINARLAKNPPEPYHFEVGQYVLAHWPHDHAPSKLCARYQGPLVVLSSFGSNSFTCQDPASLRVSNYSAKQLLPFIVEPDKVDPDVIAAQNRGLWIVEAIVDHRKSKRSYEFKVRWLGFGQDGDTWEPAKNLRQNSVLAEYLVAHPEIKIR